MEIYFLRHGRAADAESSQDDFERPLTDEGRARMEREARAITQLVPALDRILTSPRVRARQTAEIVAGALKLRDRLIEDERLDLYFDLDRLCSILAAYQDARALMLVGHEPSLSTTIGRLIGGASIELKKGSLARVDVPDAASARGYLSWLVPPKVLLYRASASCPRR